jgi:hypothetical protein
MVVGSHAHGLLLLLLLLLLLPLHLRPASRRLSLCCREEGKYHRDPYTLDITLNTPRTQLKVGSKNRSCSPQRDWQTKQASGSEMLIDFSRPAWCNCDVWS